jgi:hypothetical protein
VVLRILEHLVQHIQGVDHRVDADQIRSLQRAHLVSEAALEDRIHIRWSRQPLLHRQRGFVHEQMRHAIGDEAWAILHHHRGLAQLA